MKVQCVACKHFDLRSAGKVTDDGPSKGMAQFGFGNCKQDTTPWCRAVFHSATWPRECSKFSQEESNKVEGRVMWLQQQKEKNK